MGDRMKRYESAAERYLVPRTPLMIRLDGKGFSKFTRGLDKPMDENMRLCMEYAAYELMRDIEGCRFAYTQSDEITLMLVDYATNETQPWFNYRANKVESIAAAICTSAFIKAAIKYMPAHLAKKGFPKFDARAFNVPREDVCNNVLWRQQDATRNAIQSLGHSYFSHKELQGKSCNDIQAMLLTEEDENFNDQPAYYKRGFSLYKVEMLVEGRDGKEVIRKKIIVDLDMPIVSKDRVHVERWLEPAPDYSLQVVNPTGNINIPEELGFEYEVPVEEILDRILLNL